MEVDRNRRWIESRSVKARWKKYFTESENIYLMHADARE